MTPFILSLISLLSLGAAWFFAARSAKDMDPLSSNFVFQAIGIPVFLVFLPWINPAVNQAIVLPVLLIGIFETFVMLLLFYSMKIGDVSVVIPITDGYVIVTVILSMLFLREILPLTGIIGIILIITGISLISTSANNLNLSNFFNFRKGALPAFLVAIGTGFYFFLVGTVSRGGNWFEVALGIRVAISLTAFAIILLKKIKLMELFKGIVWKWILPGAFLDVLGFTFYNIAISRAGVSYSTIMISAQSLVTVLLSYFFLKEKIYPRQWAGILTALFGLISLQIK